MYSKDIGGIAWIDLTVKDATPVHDFYKAVIGFDSEAHSMGDYDDYVMKSPANSDDAVGICHAKGPNTDLPPQWIIYFNVENIDQSVTQCIENGGQIIRNKSDMGDYTIAVLKDPAGAVFALIQTK